MKYIQALSAVLLFSVQLAPSANATSTPDDSTTTHPDMLETVWQDAEIVGEEGLAWLLAPLSYSRNEWMMTAGIGAATLATYAVDGEVRELMLKNQQDGWYDAASLANEGGRVLWAQALTGALYLPGLLFDIEDLRVTGRMLGQSLIYSGAVTMTFRVILGRDRPYAGKGPSSLGWMEFGNAEQSFPSGHTTVAFAMASVLSRRIKQPVVTVLLYAAATATGLARMYHDQHWASDVLIGAVIGHSAGMYVASCEEKRSEGAHEAMSGWLVLPSPGGLNVQYRF